MLLIHRTALVLAFCFGVPCAPALAHIGLLAPNGGETLRVGEVSEIRWRVSVEHNTQDWDVWYSTSGANGPWIPIATDLPAGDTTRGAVHSFDWRVPDDVSDTVLIRVRQDNAGQDYEAISDNFLRIVPSLAVDRASLSLSTGGTQRLSLDGGAANAGRTYLVLGSTTGTSPGFTFDSVEIPLVPDWYLLHAIAQPNGAILGMSLGTLSGSGQATATFSLPPGFNFLAGLTFHHAFVALEESPLAIKLASNPVSVALLP